MSPSLKVGSSNSLRNQVLEAPYISIGSSGAGELTDVSCDSNVAVGDVVYMNGSTATRAIASSISTSTAIGICSSKPTSTSCSIAISGLTISLNGLTAGNDYFLDPTTPGAITTTVPTGSSQVVLLLGRAISTTLLSINIGIPLIRA